MNKPDLIDRYILADLVDANGNVHWEDIANVPTIEEQKKGEWIELTNTNHSYVCSVCGRMLVNVTDGKNTVTKNYPFCHCGADMRKGEDKKE